MGDAVLGGGHAAGMDCTVATPRIRLSGEQRSRLPENRPNVKTVSMVSDNRGMKFHSTRFYPPRHTAGSQSSCLPLPYIRSYRNSRATSDTLPVPFLQRMPFSPLATID